MIIWPTIEEAIHDWIITGSGLTENQVIWSQQSSPRPVGQYISITIMSVASVGMDWNEVIDNPDPEEGEEIKILARGTREAALTLQCYGGSGIGANSPRARLEGIVSSASLASRRDELGDAGVGILFKGPVQTLTGLVGAGLESRAIVEFRLALASEISETATYVESAEVTTTVSELALTPFIVDIND